MTYEHIDWDLQKSLIQHTSLRAIPLLNITFYGEPKSSKSSYANKHLGSESLSFYPRIKNDLEILRRYNPFGFRIPYNLTALNNFFEFDYARRLNPCGLNITPAEERLSFLGEYHLLYADILEALNGDNNAESRLRKKIYTDSMY
jgi:hypothetical protein